jgi:hypothetical protein
MDRMRQAPEVDFSTQHRLREVLAKARNADMLRCAICSDSEQACERETK